MTKRYTKPVRKAFVNKVIELFEPVAGQPQGNLEHTGERSYARWETYGSRDNPTQYVLLDSNVGQVQLTAVEATGNMLSLFTRFKDIERAKAAGYDCNQFNGKWNHHFGWGYEGEMMERAFARIKADFEKLEVFK